MNSGRTETKLNEKLRLLLRAARRNLGRADWGKSHFDRHKALTLALFSEIAYFKIGEQEYRRPSRAKIIPCSAYQLAITTQARIQFEAVVRSEDFDDFFVIESRNFVAVGFPFKEMAVVAVRGTRYLYDWTVNFRARKSSSERHELRLHGGILRETRREPKLHAGFLREAQLLGVHLKERLSRHHFDGKKIVFTGHSLGGAVAAIKHGENSRDDWSVAEGGCYVFAAPRFASFNSLLRIDNPFNSVNDFDVVPRLPPRLLGYDNSIFEFDLGGSPYMEFDRSQLSIALEWAKVIATGRFLKNHSMEIYRRKIRNHLMPHEPKPKPLPFPDHPPPL